MPKKLPPLVPDHHPNPDFFVCDIFDSAPKSDQASMEFPLFALTTKPDLTIKEYRFGDKEITLTPSAYGLATVHDRDILIYCISQCMARINNGQRPEKTLRFQASDLMRVTNRQTNGQGYALLRKALDRLQTTQIKTNITTGGIEEWEIFSFIESARIVRETREGRMQEVEITLSNWVFNAIQEKGGDILTISRDYFRLRKPLARRLYELARKHCGTSNKEWKFSLAKLKSKSGSSDTLRKFRAKIKDIIADQEDFPDYRFELKEDVLYIYPKGEFIEAMNRPTPPQTIADVELTEDTLQIARNIGAGLDMAYLENEWRAMLSRKDSVPENPQGSFIGFVKYMVENN